MSDELISNSIKELVYKATTTTPSTYWERELYAFVKEWIGPGEFIEVKTSGSTGLPKVIRHSKEAMRKSAAMTCDFLGLEPGMNALLCLSTRSIAGMMMVVRAFERSMDIIPVAPVGHPLKAIEENIDIDFCAMVPAQVYNSLSLPDEKKKLKKIRSLIVGGAPVSYSLQQEISTLEGKVFSTFGMTETMSHVAMRRLNGREASDEFMTLPGIRIETGSKIDNDISENQLAKATAGSIGNLIIHVPYIETSPVITNDIVEITGQQSFRWLGRLDHVINTGGFKIFPEEIETKIASVMHSMEGKFSASGSSLQKDQSTQRYFIAPLPDKKLGQIPVLIIEAPEPTAIYKESVISELQKKLSGNIAKHEVPRAVYFVPRFIETPTGKIIRSATLKLVMSDE